MCGKGRTLLAAQRGKYALTAHAHALLLPQGAVSATGGAEIFISTQPCMEAVLTCPSETRSIGRKAPHP
jgi:hypothetical protein